MTILGSKIIQDAQTDLQDPEGTRWPVADLAGYLNDGQRELVVARPDETTRTFEATLVQGAEQQLPAAAMLLVDVPRNAAGRRTAIEKTDRRLLEAVQRDWQSMAGATEFVHFMHDMREPRLFLMYPPAKAGAKVVLTCSMFPQDVPADGAGPIGVADQWANALRHYVVFRAFSKDAEYAANATLAASHLALFNSATGAQLQAAAAVAPKS